MIKKVPKERNISKPDFQVGEMKKRVTVLAGFLPAGSKNLDKTKIRTSS